MPFLYRLSALLLLGALLQLALGGCATSADLPTVLSQPLDTTLQRQVAHQLAVRHLKIKGNVTVQLGTGNSNTDGTRSHGPVAGGQGKAQDLSHAGQGGGALATEPGASAGATTFRGVPAWLLALGAVVLVLLLLLGLVYRYRDKLLQ